MEELNVEFYHLIEEDDLSGALDVLTKASPQNVNDIILTKSRLNRLKKSQNNGVTSEANANVSMNQISSAILSLGERILGLPISSTSTPSSDLKSSTSQTQIYLSYSWGDENEEKGKSREDIVNRMSTSLRSAGYNIIRDKDDMNLGDSISGFMKDLGRSDLIIVFVTDKYVRSEYSMFELYEISRNSRLDKEIFSKRIIPISVESLYFNKPSTLLKYFKYWEEKEAEWANLLDVTKNNSQKAMQKRYNQAKDIRQNLGDLLDWITDVNSLTLELIEENDFARVKKIIDKRLALLNQD